MRPIDGLNRKKEFKPSPKDEGSFEMPENVEELVLDQPVEISNPRMPDVVIIGKKKKRSGFLKSPLGLRKSKEKRSIGLPIKRKERKFLFLKVFFLFFTIFLILFLGIRAKKASAEIQTLSRETKEHLTLSLEYIDEGELPLAMSEANIASQKIKRLKLLTQSWGQDVRFFDYISTNSKFVANERLLDATYLIVNTLTNINKEFASLSGGNSSGDFISKGSDFLFNIAESQKAILTMAAESKANLTKSRDQLQRAKGGLSLENKNQVDNAIAAIDKTITSLEFVESLTESDIPWLSGADGKEKKVLILFQNNSELRGGSGGSLGSFGVANFSNGKLLNVDFGKNIFKIDHAFEATKEFIEPPETIKWLRGDLTWTLKDSGWAVDGPESFQRVVQFYEKETGESVDGVIMIDTTAVISLLQKVGTIELPQYGKTINSDNFRQEVEYEVHKGYFDRDGGKEENEPKKILSDMMPIFISRIFDSLGNKDKSTQVLSSLSKSLKQKDIELYFTKKDFQEKINKLNYSGSVYPSLNDYLYINNSNIDGGKSSLKIDESLIFKSQISESGEITDELTISRKHNGDGKWPDDINKNFVRLLLPEKTALKKFEPKGGYFELFFDKGLKDGKYYWETDEAGKKTINFWMSTKPKEQSELNISYSPNYSVDTSGDFSYTLNIQKQPGALPDNFFFELKYPDGFHPTNVKGYDEKANRISLKFQIDKDRMIKINFKKKIF